MILKKPYAFLIKNFKIIHLVSIIGLIFVVSKTNGLISFFSSYSNSGNYLYNNNVIIEYISLSVFGVVLLLLALYAVIGYLLKKKNKPFNVYIYECIYYLILFFFLFFINSLISGLGDNVLDGRTIRIYRDISLIVTLPQYYFIIFNFIRGIGFDLKKFDFNKDLVNIQVESGDDEEIEFEIGAESYKYKRSIRRFLRELRYYILENKIGFLVACGVLLISGFLFIKITATDSITYTSVDNAFQVDNFTIKVNDAVVTKFDYNGNVIDGNYYLLINVDIYNPQEKRVFNDDNMFLVLEDGDLFSYPTTIFKEKFYDLGQIYIGEEIKTGEKINRVIAFPFRKKNLSSKYLIRSIKSIKYIDGALDLQFNNYKVKPDNLYELEDTRIVKLGEKLSFAGSTARNTEITINKYYFTSSYNYYYNFCLSEDRCQKSIGTITPSKPSSNFTLMVLEYNGTFSENLSYALLHEEDFFQDYMYVEYTKNGETNRVKTTSLSTYNDLLSNVYIAEVKKEVAEADHIDIIFKVRTKSFKINVK